MKVTKYPQSCLLLEKGDTRVVIDPGSVFTASYDRDELGQLDGVFYTHIHDDHLDDELAQLFIEQRTQIYGNQSVADALDGSAIVLDHGDTTTVGDFRIYVHDLPHCLMPDGSEGPPNTGFVFDDTFFHPGDGIETDGLSVDDVAAPVAGPDVSPRTMFAFAKSLGAKRILPIHNDYFHENIDTLIQINHAFSLGFEFIPLDNGESIEL